MNSYSFKVNDGSNYQYFRLKQEDFDGESTYSETIIFENKSIKFRLEVYPNPFEDVISIKIQQAGRYIVLLTDLLGNEITKTYHDVNDNYPSLKLNGLELLKSGVYFMQIKTEELEYKMKLIKK